MTRAADVVVVGGGPAGMSAAVAAADAGLTCTLVDEGFDLGGQIYRTPTSPARAPAPHPRGEGLRAEVRARADRIDVRSGAVAWGVFDGPRIAVTSGESTELLHPKATVLAPGAHELVPPFPGWTLPGVMTPGAAQVLVKTMGVAPGRRVIVAGTGPFLLTVACQMVAGGVEVVSVIEASPRLPWLLLPFHGFRTPAFLRDGLHYLRVLRHAGVPVRYGRIVTAASGDGAVRTVTHAPCDAQWFPDRARAETEDVDALLVGYGFVPRVDLAQMAGCRMEHRPDVGGWVAARSATLETSVPSIFAAGDGAGVAGALVAEREGRLAGLAAAARIGALSAAAFASERAPVERELARIAPIRRALDRISAIRPGLASLVEDDTIVCRCEEVPWRDAREAARNGCATYRSAKVATRAGMGACQGSFCWPSLARLAAAELRCAVEDVGPRSARPPLRPISLGALAAAPGEGGVA